MIRHNGRNFLTPFFSLTGTGMLGIILTMGELLPPEDVVAQLTTLARRSPVATIQVIHNGGPLSHRPRVIIHPREIPQAQLAAMAESGNIFFIGPSDIQDESGHLDSDRAARLVGQFVRIMMAVHPAISLTAYAAGQQIDTRRFASAAVPPVVSMRLNPFA